tara:strand:+ start:738 stop:860 length:123 start_codon:yes stop_codon:yes gene_type:complete
MDLETGIVAHSEMVPWRNPNYAGADMNYRSLGNYTDPGRD